VKKRLLFTYYNHLAQVQLQWLGMIKLL